MQTYIYKGTIKTSVNGVILTPGSLVNLPEDHARVKSLVAMKLLELKITKKEKK